VGGIILYGFTLLLETISVIVRYALVSWLAGLLLGPEAGAAIGGLAAGGPILYSLLVLAGVPSGHVLVRRSLGARPLSAGEQARLDAALAVPRAAGLPLPRRAFTIPEEGLNAAISGRTLYVYRELYDSPYLPGVLAHELGHFNSSDGRLLLAIRALTVPGGYLLAWALLLVLRWVAYGVASVLIALLLVLFALFRVRLDSAAAFLFRNSVSLVRMAIIFAVGGVGPNLLGSLWRSYFVEREYAADAYAGRLGYANDLITFFENEVLNDVIIPWQEQPSHPPATRRVAALREIAAKVRQRPTPSPAAAPPLARPAAPALAAHFTARQPAPAGRPHSAWPWLAVGLAALAALALAGALAMGVASPAPARNTMLPTPGPTPTLGLPRLP